MRKEDLIQQIKKKGTLALQKKSVGVPFISKLRGSSLAEQSQEVVVGDDSISNINPPDKTKGSWFDSSPRNQEHPVHINNISF